jgi:hypothetical protein
LRFARPDRLSEEGHVDESESDRKLKHGDEANVHTHFTLTTSLKIQSSDDKDDKTQVLMFVSCALVGFALSVAAVVCSVSFAGLASSKKNAGQAKKTKKKKLPARASKVNDLRQRRTRRTIQNGARVTRMTK